MTNTPLAKVDTLIGFRIGFRSFISVGIGLTGVARS